MATLPTLGPRRTPNAGRAIDTGVRPVDLNTSVDTSNVGRAVQGFAQTVSGVADNMQKEEDASAIFAARRGLDDWERTAIYDPEKGAIGKKGADAFDLPKIIPAEFDKAASEIGKNLKTERQRRTFEELATSRRAQLGDWAARHSTQQRQVYNEGQYNADIDSGLNRAAMLASAGDFNTAKAEVGLMQTRTAGYLRSLGKSEEEIGVAVRNVASKANVTAINVLLEKDRPVEAEKYLKDNAASMNVEDLLRAQSAVGKSVDARVGLVTATEIVQNAVKPALAPTDTGRLVTLAGPLDFNRLNEAKRKVESGNRDFNKDGSVVTSKTGAKGKDQVLDSTNRDPGYGVVPARDDSLAERSRVGTDYMAAMLREFKGDVPKALAAYNAGPGAVQKAVEAANKQRTSDWLSNLSPEAQAYVPKVLKAYEAGGGAPAMPTLQDLHAQVRARPGMMDSPLRYKTAIAEVDRQYKEMLDAKKQVEETNLAEAMKEVAANGGRVSKLSPGRLASLAPKDLDNLYSYGQKVAKGDDITNPVLFQKMATDDAYLKGMTDQQFFIQTRQLSEADGEKMAMRRGQLLNKPEGSKPTDLDTTAINSVLNNRLQQIGVDPTPKDAGSDAQRVGAIRQTVWTAVQRAQVTAGKKLNDTEIAKVVDELFVQQATVPGGFFSKGSKQVNLMRMKPGDIPSDVREALQKDFKKAGIDNPTPGDFLGAYLQLQTAGK